MKDVNVKDVLEKLDPRDVFKEMGQMCGPSTNCECKCSDNDSTISKEVSQIYENE